MESEYKTEKKKFNKKLLLIPLALVVFGVAVYAISAYYATLHITGNVNEDIQVWDGSNWQTINQVVILPVQVIPLFPHQPAILATVSIKNLAGVNEKVYLDLPTITDWTITASDGTNIYALDGSATLVSSGQHDIVITAVYDGETFGAVYNADLTIGGTLQA